MDPTQSQSLAQGFDLLFKALKNLSDGSMPVFSNEYGQIENDLSDPAFQNSLFNQSVKQFTIFLERVSFGCLGTVQANIFGAMLHRSSTSPASWRRASLSSSCAFTRCLNLHYKATHGRIPAQATSSASSKHPNSPLLLLYSTKRTNQLIS